MKFFTSIWSYASFKYLKKIAAVLPIYSVSQKTGTRDMPHNQMWTNFNNFPTVLFLDELQEKRWY